MAHVIEDHKVFPATHA